MDNHTRGLFDESRYILINMENDTKRRRGFRGFERKSLGYELPSDDTSYSLSSLNRGSLMLGVGADLSLVRT